MAELRSEKYVNNLPPSLVANTIYYVKTGSVINIYVTNDTGLIVAYPVNSVNSSSSTEIEIDFGTTPVSAKRFEIIDAAVTNTSRIMVTPSGNVATGRGIDDWEWDSVQFAAKSGTGTFTLYGKASGKIAGKRKIIYSINN